MNQWSIMIYNENPISLPTCKNYGTRYQMYLYCTDLPLRHSWDWCNSDSVPRNAFITLRRTMTVPPVMLQISHINSWMTGITAVWTTSGIAFAWTQVGMYVRTPKVQEQIDKTWQNRTESCKIGWFCSIWFLCCPECHSAPEPDPLLERANQTEFALVVDWLAYWVICHMMSYVNITKIAMVKAAKLFDFRCPFKLVTGWKWHRTLSCFLFRPAPPSQHVFWSSCNPSVCPTCSLVIPFPKHTVILAVQVCKKSTK